MNIDPADMVVRIPVLLFSITAHEYAHARAAFKMGDTTAQDAGRLTFNPISHIDPFGAICLFLFNFGWAKPVPINPLRFSHIRNGIVFTSVSGPMANFAIAFLAGMMIRFFPFPSDLYAKVMGYLLFMNIGLGLFNLIPLPPLDGSHILENLLPPESAMKFRQFSRYAPIILISIILMDNFAHTGIISMILVGPMRFMAYLFSGIPF